MPPTLLPPTGRDPAAASPARSHDDIDDQAVLDFLHGDYALNPARAQPFDRYPAPPATTGSESPGGYAVVQYDRASRVRWVTAPFGDALTAEEYAIARDFVQYDVVPATPITR
jgi:hypothetical protein